MPDATMEMEVCVVDLTSAEEEALRLKKHLASIQSELQSAVASHQVEMEGKEEGEFREKKTLTKKVLFSLCLFPSLSEEGKGKKVNDSG